MSTAIASAVLRQAGLAHPGRLVDLMRRTIAFLELDLRGLCVLTEAASGPYTVTPVIAALAGADRVIALTRASRYGSLEAVIAQTQALAELCSLDVQVQGVAQPMLPGLTPRPENPSRPTAAVEICSERSAELFAAADIITNLGFVRPIDAAAVATMKPTAVVPLMCEAWEIRPGDVDLAACRAAGIPVIATNEDYPGLEVFAYSGWLALKMLFAAQVEVHKSTVVVVSSDRFGPVIADRLRRAGAMVRLLPDLRSVAAGELDRADALIVADYTRSDPVIGPAGDVTAAELAAACPGAAVIQFAGVVDVASLLAHEMPVYPGIDLPARRMARTLADLGPRPVIELHAAGLKVGELAARARLVGRFAAEEAEIVWRGHVLGQRVA